MKRESCKFENIKKEYVFCLIISISLISIPMISGQMESASSDDPLAGSNTLMSENLIIEGDEDFENYSFITGNGSRNNPYVISGLDMFIYCIQISNTTSFFTITDIEWGTSAEYRMIFRNNDHINLENLALDSSYFFKSIDCLDLKMNNCSFSTTLKYESSILCKNLSSLNVENSNFMFIWSSQNIPSYFNFSGNSGMFHISNSTFSQIFVESFIHGTQIIEHSTFMNAGLSPKGMSASSSIRNCSFTGNGAGGYHGLRFDSTAPSECNNGAVYNNTFTNCNMGMELKGTNPNAARVQIFNNTFDYCKRGLIATSWNADIFDNVFSNNRFFAITFEWDSMEGWNNTIWMNLFQNNNKYYPNNGAQSDGGPTGNFNIYDNGIIGNYWDDHLSPDEDRNGIVDIPYSLSGTGKNSDKLPVANINFDVDQPDASFTTNTFNFIDRSYHRIGWETGDEWGIQKVELNGTDGKWTNVTEINSTTVFLEKGPYNFSLKATDNNGLARILDLGIELNQTVPVLNISSPSNGCFIENDPVTAEWKVVEYFPVYELNFSVDGEWTLLDTAIRSLNLDLEEGPHSISISVLDDHDLLLTENIEFTVDRFAPQISLHGPSPGSIISSQSVNFDYSVFDITGIKTIRYRFNEEDWTMADVDGSITVVLNEGEHLFEIEAMDNAGHLTVVKVPFEISNDNEVDIISPVNGTVFSSSIYSMQWDYDGVFEWSSALIRVGIQNDFISIGESHEYEMTFPEDGEYLISIKLVDDSGNYVQSDIWVIKDSKSPLVGFLGIDEGDFLRFGNISLKWNAVDNIGIRGYQLCIDDDAWKDMEIETSLDLDLEEGEHLAKIRAIDLAGNIHQAQIRFIVDTTAPLLSFIEMGTLIQTSRDIKVEWESEDINGIVGMDLTIEGEKSRDVLGKDHLSIILTEDGHYKVTLNASDVAGNNASISMIITVDLTEPKAYWVGETVSVSSQKDLLIQWEIEEEMGISEIFLEVDGEKIALDINDTVYTLELLEGTHTISLTVIDKAKWIYKLDYPNQVIIDPTEPILTIDESRNVQNGIAALSWTASDGTSNIENVSISLDGGEFIEVEGDSYSTEILPPGDHTLVVRAIDSAGNVVEETWTFTVLADQIGETDDGGGSSILLIVFIVVILLAIAGGILFVVFRRSRTGKVEEEKDQVKGAEQSSVPVGPTIGTKNFISAPPHTNGPQLSSLTQNSLPPAQHSQEVHNEPVIDDPSMGSATSDSQIVK